MSDTGSSLGGGARTLLVLAALAIVVAGLKSAASLIQPFLVAALLAAMSMPLMHWLRSKQVPRIVAVPITILAVLLVLTVAGFLVGGSINSFTEALPRYQSRLQAMVNAGIAWLNDRGVEVPRQAVTDLVNPGIVLDMVGNLLTTVASFLSKTVLVILTMVFILLEAAGFSDKLHIAFGRDREQLLWFSTIRMKIQRYLAVKTLISICTGVTVGLALWALQIDFPLLWGLLAFILNFIPNLGSILAALPTVLLTIVQHGIGRAIVVAIIYLLVNMTFGNAIEPYFMGRRLGLSTLVVFLSMVFWGWIWGPLGMLLSVPLTMIVKIMLENSSDLRWIAVLLDANPPEGSGTAA
jgi:predicted PurR-regulated permease PerM